jgi:hypothetical protein
MFLTKTIPILGDDYKAHQTIKQWYEGNQKILYQRSDYATTILSDNPPHNIPRGITKEIDLSKFTQLNDQHIFSIRLNTAYKPSNRKNRIPIPVPKINNWIKNKLNEAGINANFQYKIEGNRNTTKQNTNFSMHSTIVTGILSITDPTKFQQTLTNGIGQGKCLGFGMLNIFM